MNDSQPKYRIALNASQLSILHDLYKFRFATSDLLMKSQGLKTKRYLYVRLKILCDQQYIGRKYDSSYRLQNKYATYHLLKKGIDALKENPVFDKQVLANIARDKTRSDKFITHSLNIFMVYIDFKRLYGDRFRFFTDSYLRGYDYFPDPAPDAYLQFKEDESQHYFIVFIEESILYFVRQNRIKKYIDYARSKKWLDETDSEMPTVIIICEKESLRYSVEHQVKKAHGDQLTYINFVVTTRDRLARGI
ncbi:replication-relaxation family protein [Candidatus Saccharibacteria bacterium]|nr:replication-relaxation family protein [Candidatus Saccharibacteria bacterium]